MIFDKGKLLSKKYCELCKKEIQPGEKMIISMICTVHERQLFNRVYEPSFYAYVGNAPR